MHSLPGHPSLGPPTHSPHLPIHNFGRGDLLYFAVYNVHPIFPSKIWAKQCALYTAKYGTSPGEFIPPSLGFFQCPAASAVGQGVEDSELQFVSVSASPIRLWANYLRTPGCRHTAWHPVGTVSVE